MEAAIELLSCDAVLQGGFKFESLPETLKCAHSNESC